MVTRSDGPAVADPQLTEDDIREALRFAAARVDERTIPIDLTA
jgi:uncharacterized protein (DUF433 family)